jgi:c-di-GMP phosphodiesterase
VSFFKRLFGFFARPEPPATAAKTPPAAPQGGPSPAAPPAREVLISWHEMIDANSRIAGYLLRPNALRPGAGISGSQLLVALEGEKVMRMAETRPTLIPLSPEQWRSADFRPLIRPHTRFLIAGAGNADVGSELEVIAAEICAAGGKLAVDLAGCRKINPALPNLLLLTNPGSELPGFEAEVRAIRQGAPQLLLAIDGVNSWSEHRYFLSLGIRYCIGGFAGQPDESEQTNRMSQSRLVIVEMLNQLRSDADLSEVAGTAKRDPAVVLKLLEMANSPLTGLSRRVANLEEAIMLLGRDALYRWLALAMFRIDASGGRDETLLTIALSRAGFLEALAPAGDTQAAGELFLVGLLSVIDSLLGLPMADILQKMRLPGAVASVLLRSEGPYARYLMLAMAMERCRIDQAVTLAGALEIDPVALMNGYSEAMAWATSDLRRA